MKSPRLLYISLHPRTDAAPYCYDCRLYYLYNDRVYNYLLHTYAAPIGTPVAAKEVELTVAALYNEYCDAYWIDAAIDGGTAAPTFMQRCFRYLHIQRDQLLRDIPVA